MADFLFIRSPLLIVFLLLMKMLPRNRWITFGGAWFFVTLLPVCHALPHHELLAEHTSIFRHTASAFIAALLLTPLLTDKRYAAVTASCLFLHHNPFFAQNH